MKGRSGSQSAAAGGGDGVLDRRAVEDHLGSPSRAGARSLCTYFAASAIRRRQRRVSAASRRPVARTSAWRIASCRAVADWALDVDLIDPHRAGGPGRRQQQQDSAARHRRSPRMRCLRLSYLGTASRHCLNRTRNGASGRYNITRPAAHGGPPCAHEVHEEAPASPIATRASTSTPATSWSSASSPL